MLSNEQLAEMFEREVGYKLNLDNPQTLNEKIQWIKQYDHNDLKTLQADKYRVREFVKEKGYIDYMNSIIAVYTSVEYLLENWYSLPEQFVVKANHWSGNVYVVKNRDTFDIKQFDKLKAAMQMKYGQDKGEYQYRDIVPRIVVEKYIDNHGEPISDYRVWCFNGTPTLIQVDENEAAKKIVNRHFYSKNWNKCTFSYNYTPNKDQIDRPARLEEMLRISEDLAKDSLLLRVDWFIVDDQLILGELTHTPASGFGRFRPQIAERFLGNCLQLPGDKQ